MRSALNGKLLTTVGQKPYGASYTIVNKNRWDRTLATLPQSMEQRIALCVFQNRHDALEMSQTNERNTTATRSPTSAKNTLLNGVPLGATPCVTIAMCDLRAATLYGCAVDQEIYAHQTQHERQARMHVVASLHHVNASMRFYLVAIEAARYVPQEEQF